MATAAVDTFEEEEERQKDTVLPHNEKDVEVETFFRFLLLLLRDGE